MTGLLNRLAARATGHSRYPESRPLLLPRFTAGVSGQGGGDRAELTRAEQSDGELGAMPSRGTRPQDPVVPETPSPGPTPAATPPVRHSELPPPAPPPAPPAATTTPPRVRAARPEEPRQVHDSGARTRVRSDAERAAPDLAEGPVPQPLPGRAATAPAETPERPERRGRPQVTPRAAPRPQKSEHHPATSAPTGSSAPPPLPAAMPVPGPPPVPFTVAPRAAESRGATAGAAAAAAAQGTAPVVSISIGRIEIRAVPPVGPAAPPPEAAAGAGHREAAASLSLGDYLRGTGGAR